MYPELYEEKSILTQVLSTLAHILTINLPFNVIIHTICLQCDY